MLREILTVVSYLMIALALTITEKQSLNQSPVANADTYTVHGVMLPLSPEVTANDYDPDGDTIFLKEVVVPTKHGDLSRLAGNDYGYIPSPGYVGPDSFTYRLCDINGACSDAIVTLNVVNEPPTGGGDRYEVHGVTAIGPMLENDFDPEGDKIFYQQLTFPEHGFISGLTEDLKLYGPGHGYVGPDSFTYRVCDEYQACSEPVTVELDVVNEPPVCGDDEYEVSEAVIIGPLRANDFDPEGDRLFDPALVVPPQHGSLTGTPDPDLKVYHPNAGFVGIDTFVYRLCDDLGACSTATVTLRVRLSDGAENLGEACPNQVGGGPINVTNGNMYLQQSDFQLPGVGAAIAITRTYNSMSKRFGLFGRGWSSTYDIALVVQDSNRLRFHSADGQATNFRRAEAGVFTPLEGDFHGRIIQNVDGTFSLQFKVGGSYLFSAEGRLLKQIDRYGNETTLTYNASDHLTAVIDPAGRAVNFSLNSEGRVETLADALGEIARYAYGANNELLSVTYPDGSGYQFSYSLSPNLVVSTVTDALGNILEAHNYDSQGRAIAFEKHGGVGRVTLNYVNDNQTDVTDALGRVTRYFFNKGLRRYLVERVEGLCGCNGGAQSKSWSYDAQLNILSHTTAANQTTSYTYDTDGNELTVTDSLGTTTRTYNALGQVLSTTDVLSAVSANSYDPQGNLLSHTNALGNTTTFTYSSQGQIESITDAHAKVTTFTYDVSGNLTESVDSAGNRTKFKFDSRGRLTRVENALGDATSYHYDAVGRLIKVTRPDGTSLQVGYDLAGRRTRVTDARNNITRFEYDTAYRLVSQTDPAGGTRTFSYDLASNLISATDELGQTTNFTYDELDRLLRVVYPPAIPNGDRLEEHSSYDVLGNIATRTDRAGKVTSFHYDAANRLVRTIDPVLNVTSYEYDARSNVTAVVDANNQRYTFAYDDLGRVVQAERAGSTMEFGYDALGNGITRTDYDGRTTNYSFDALNRLTTIAYPDATKVVYDYDALSRLTTATNINGTVSFAYDSLGRIVRTSDVFGGVLNYGYDSAGNRTRMSSSSRLLASYEYDSLDRVARITDGSGLNVGYTYDALSRVISRSLPNGLQTTYDYDGLGRLVRLKELAGSRAISAADYSYDAADNVARITAGGGTRTYDYDEKQQLVAASSPRTAEAYSYDGVGNRTSSHRSASYVYEPFNRLVSAGPANYVYDSNGNLVTKADSRGTTKFSWDFENRLVQVATPRGRVGYRYDALGRGIQRLTDGLTTNFRHDGQDVIEDRHNNLLTTEYLNGPGIDNKLRQKSLLINLYFMQDHLGSTVGLTDQRGRVAEQVNYDSYGNSAGPLLTRFGYTGRERDPLTGLLYYRARWYDPDLGRFISEDPLGLAGGVNSYAYVRNNPVNRKDPFGLYEIDVHYYLTYYLAIKTGCFSDREAREIANGNQRADEDAGKVPALGITSQQRGINAFYHALHGGTHQTFLDSHWMLATQSRSGNLTALGTYLHYLQDIFSHSGYTDSKWGHSPRHLATHSVDKTDYDVGKSMIMAQATWDRLVRFAKLIQCKCNPPSIRSWWGTVKAFAEAPGGNWYTKKRYTIEQVNPWYLENKRRILLAPLR